MEIGAWIFLGVSTILGFTSIPVAVLFGVFNSILNALIGRTILWIPAAFAGALFWFGVGCAWSAAFSESFPIILAVVIATLQGVYIWLMFEKLVVAGKFAGVGTLCCIAFLFGAIKYGFNYT